MKKMSFVRPHRKKSGITTSETGDRPMQERREWNTRLDMQNLEPLGYTATQRWSTESSNLDIAIHSQHFPLQRICSPSSQSQRALRVQTPPTKADLWVGRLSRGRWGDMGSSWGAVGIFAFKNINRTLKNTVTRLKYSAILHLQINAKILKCINITKAITEKPISPHVVCRWARE